MTTNEITIKIKALKAMRNLNEILDDKEIDNIIHNKLDNLAFQFEKQRLEEERGLCTNDYRNLVGSL